MVVKSDNIYVCAKGEKIPEKLMNLSISLYYWIEVIVIKRILKNSFILIENIPICKLYEKSLE